jgi:hypothetical protein
MSTVYTASYTDQAVAKARAPLSIPADDLASFAIPIPADGFLTRLTVYQLTGTAVDFSVELLTSSIPYPPGNQAQAASPACPLEPFRVQLPMTGPLTASAGDVLNYATDEIGLAYRNMDGTANEPVMFLYLVIIPAASAPLTTWAAYLQVREEPHA